ncbi:hypothetical protein BJV78DRAFT_1363664 [Lactifluus subvellereus]|nr:hypothetical protein BJV78DRAFT_1363664 [Lactifluus subvellereus]
MPAPSSKPAIKVCPPHHSSSARFTIEKPPSHTQLPALPPYSGRVARSTPVLLDSIPDPRARRARAAAPSQPRAHPALSRRRRLHLRALDNTFDVLRGSRIVNLGLNFGHGRRSSHVPLFDVFEDPPNGSVHALGLWSLREEDGEDNELEAATERTRLCVEEWRSRSHTGSPTSIGTPDCST